MIGFIIAANGIGIVDGFWFTDGVGRSIIHRPRGILYEAWYTVIPNERLPTDGEAGRKRKGRFLLRALDALKREGLPAKVWPRYEGFLSSFLCSIFVRGESEKKIDSIEN